LDDRPDPTYAGLDHGVQLLKRVPSLHSRVLALPQGLTECDRMQRVLQSRSQPYPLVGLATAKDLKGVLQIDRKTIYSYAERGLIPYIRIESSLRFPKHRVLRWLEERSFQPRPVNGKGAHRQTKDSADGQDRYAQLPRVV
jgi:Helix-turn-helix domain